MRKRRERDFACELVHTQCHLKTPAGCTCTVLMDPAMCVYSILCTPLLLLLPKIIVTKLIRSL